MNWRCNFSIPALLLLGVFLFHPSPASATSFVCIGDMATGFSYTRHSKTWHQDSFRSGSKFIAKPSSGDWKWEVTRTGDNSPIPDYWSKNDFNDYGMLRMEGIAGVFLMNKEILRFLRTHDAGYWNDDVKNSGKGFTPGTNTPIMELGQCSILEP